MDEVTLWTRQKTKKTGTCIYLDYSYVACMCEEVKDSHRKRHDKILSDAYVTSS